MSTKIIYDLKKNMSEFLIQIIYMQAKTITMNNEQYYDNIIRHSFYYLLFTTQVISNM